MENAVAEKAFSYTFRPNAAGLIELTSTVSNVAIPESSDTL
jgi:hypothetical protein